MRRTLHWIGLSLALSCSQDTGSNTATQGSQTSGDTDSSPANDSAGADDSEGGADGDTGEAAEECFMKPREEARVYPGLQPDGSTILVNGRRTTPVGTNFILQGAPMDVAVHPLGNVAYVATAGRYYPRKLQVIDLANANVVQEFESDVYYGVQVSADGARVYVPQGGAGGLTYYDADIDGTLTLGGTVGLPGFTTGTALSPDGSTPVGSDLNSPTVSEIDTETMTVARTLEVSEPTWDLEYVPSRDELWATALGGETITVLDVSTEAIVDTLEVGRAPAMLARRSDDSALWVSFASRDEVVAFDPETREVTGRSYVAETDFVDDRGAPLPNGNLNALLYDEASDLLYAARGEDNAVSLLDASTLSLVGSFPTGGYPTGLAFDPDENTMIVSELRTSGVRGDENYRGGATIVDLDDLDLATTTNAVVENFRRPVDLFDPITCGDDFPVPFAEGMESPIEHVILVVKENNTFDSIYGASGDELGVDADPDFLKWSAAESINHRKVAREFAIGDNFFNDSTESDSGHTFLTNSLLTEWAQRIWQQRDVFGVYEAYPILEPVRPYVGNFFTWVVDNGVTLQVFGEIVGMLAETADGTKVSDFSDSSYPGGPFINYDAKDADRGRYVGEEFQAGEAANFTYMLLPNDHGNGVQPGVPTPASLNADNDEGLGLLVDLVSKSDLWEKTLIIVLQDDPQGSDDHVDEGRSYVLMISPWVRRGYVSKVQYSYTSVFATIERILGLPPMGRNDAAHAPMYDFFTNVPNFTPYDALPREYPEETGDASMPGASVSRCMDFRGPDRNPELGLVNMAWARWKRGELTRDQAQAMIDAGVLDEEEADELEEEAEEETIMFDLAYRRYVAAHEAAGLPVRALPPGPPADCPRREWDRKVLDY